MFSRLRKKWNVGWLQFVLIFCTFAVGGTLTGKLTNVILQQIGIPFGFLKVLLYIFIATPLWMVVIILTSIPFGQFSFFYNYVKTIILKFSKQHGKKN